mgnify:CR=1 FL=1
MDVDIPPAKVNNPELSKVRDVESNDSVVELNPMVDIPVILEFTLTTLVDIPPILLETISTDFAWNTESIRIKYGKVISNRYTT